MTFKEVAAEQKMPLEYKIDTAVAAIEQAFAVSANPGLAFSGGKDSTVLWHLIRSRFPEQAGRLHIIFGNTGCEYPEACVSLWRWARSGAGNCSTRSGRRGRSATA